MAPYRAFRVTICWPEREWAPIGGRPILCSQAAAQACGGNAQVRALPPCWHGGVATQSRLQHLSHHATPSSWARKNLFARRAARVLASNRKYSSSIPMHARNNRPRGTLFRPPIWRKNGRRAITPRRPVTLLKLFGGLSVDQQFGLPQRELLTFSFNASRPTAPTTTSSPIT